MTAVMIRMGLTDRLPVLTVDGDIESLLGIGANVLLHDSTALTSRVHVDDADVAQTLFAATRDETVAVANLRLRHASGRIRCVQASYRKLASADGIVLDLQLRDAQLLAVPMGDPATLVGLRAMLDTTDDFIYFKDRNHVFTAASRSMVALCPGASHWTDLIGKTDYDLVAEAYADDYYKLEKEIYAGAPVARALHSWCAKDGRTGWADNRKYPVRDANGTIVGLYGVARDVTELVHVESALRNERERSRAILETVAAPIFVKDSSHRVVSANQAFYEWVGLPADRVLGHTLEAAFPPEQYQYIIAGDRQVLDSGVADRSEVTLTLQNQQRTMIVKKSCLVDHTGARFVVGAIHDITAIRAAERAQRDSNRRWRFAVEGAGDGLWDWDLTTGAVYYSARWKQMLGFADDEIGNSIDEWRSRVHPDDLLPTQALVEAHIANMAPNYVSEHRVRCRDGSWKWILDRGLVMERDADGKALRMIGTHTDISERKRTEEAISASNAVLSQFNALAVGRELRMVELKREINALRARLGEPPLHRVADVELAQPESG